MNDIFRKARSGEAVVEEYEADDARASVAANKPPSKLVAASSRERVSDQIVVFSHVEVWPRRIVRFIWASRRSSNLTGRDSSLFETRWRSGTPTSPCRTPAELDVRIVLGNLSNQVTSGSQLAAAPQPVPLRFHTDLRVVDEPHRALVLGPDDHET